MEDFFPPTPMQTEKWFGHMRLRFLLLDPFHLEQRVQQVVGLFNYVLCTILCDCGKASYIYISTLLRQKFHNSP